MKIAKLLLLFGSVFSWAEVQYDDGQLYDKRDEFNNNIRKLQESGNTSNSK